jgi:predicted HAD superfamily Cof-like phosphohydrolase
MEFHELFQHPIKYSPELSAANRTSLRIALINEEAREFEAAVAAGDLVEVADALGDLLYVTFGAAVEFGLDMDVIVDEIHASNLSKLGTDGKPARAENGKILKGPNFRPPDLARVIEELKNRK